MNRVGKNSVAVLLGMILLVVCILNHDLKFAMVLFILGLAGVKLAYGRFIALLFPISLVFMPFAIANTSQRGIDLTSKSVYYFGFLALIIAVAHYTEGDEN